ncbi:septum formation inhibitor Maf [Idiomarina tyrosinivorans]|uniref:Septum formation inhibitor Maf n=1 Tax=Idiomarina tyrosinivorans TaxID=1445662 RepID=A0A432ZPH3_9GAMM|nr:6-hydroxymethylpterin diphosphokinase MptE-like protein [Idiomarina tyrosinivorans]RUO79825.1 septum formation inhibitor Maf [Idiomarina tyrosinivorans]
MASVGSSLNEAMQKLQSAQSQLEREQVFAQHAQQRFQQNVEAFEKYYPNIAKAITEFQTDDALPLFVTQSGHGNIMDGETGIAIYNDDPVKQSQQQVDTQLSKPSITHIHFAGYAHDDASDTRLHAIAINKLGHIVKDLGYPTPVTDIGERFPTAVIFGIGLGYHLPELLDRVQFDYIFLLEPSFQNFYLSLFCIDWASLIKKVDDAGGCFFFHLGVSYKDFMDDLWNISKNIGAFCLTKCFCYQHLPTPQTNRVIKEFRERLFEIHGGYGFYNDATTALAHTVLNAKRGMNLLKFGTEKNNPYADVPVYIVGNGPSLDEAKDFIRDTQQQAIIIAAGTALQTLLKNDIQPDFHVLIERPKNTYDVLVATLPLEAYKSLNLLTMNLIYPDVVDLYGWVGMGGKGVDAAGDLLNYVMLSEVGQSLRFPMACNPLVSNTALSYAVSLGFKKVYLFGVDNGYTLDGKHHSEDSDYYKGKLASHKNPAAKHRLAGNLDEDVMATDFLAISCRQMGRLLEFPEARGVECYNVGPGARIAHALPLRAEHVLPEFVDINKENVVEFIKQEQFQSFQFDNFEPYMQFELFEEICDHLVSIGSESITTRAEALDNLRRQARYLYSFRGTKLSHLFYVLDGEMLYFHCPMMSILYAHQDEDRCLQAFQKAMSEWLNFVKTAKTDLRTSWLEKCTMGWKG